MLLITWNEMHFNTSTVKSLERQHQISRRNYVNGMSKILVLPNTHLDEKNVKGQGERFSQTSGIILNIKRKARNTILSCNIEWYSTNQDQLQKRVGKTLFLDPLAMNVFFFTMAQAFEEWKWIYGPDENLKEWKSAIYSSSNNQHCG